MNIQVSIGGEIVAPNTAYSLPKINLLILGRLQIALFRP